MPLILSFIVVVVLVLFWTHSDFSTKDEKEVMRTTVGEFTYEPIKKVVYINDEYVSGGFPVKDSSLTLKSVSCTNGATATFDVDSWELKILMMLLKLDAAFILQSNYGRQKDSHSGLSFFIEFINSFN